MSLEEIRRAMDGEEAGESFSALLPSVQIFKEVMVELLRGREIDIEVLREERRNFIGLRRLPAQRDAAEPDRRPRPACQEGHGLSDRGREGDFL